MLVRFHDLQTGRDIVELDLPHAPRSNEHVVVDHVDYQVLRVRWVLRSHPTWSTLTVVEMVPPA